MNQVLKDRVYGKGTQRQVDMLAEIGGMNEEETRMLNLLHQGRIKMLVKDIKEELCGAEKYAKRYVEYKDTDREVSGMYRAMAEQELGHVNSLHSQAVRMIREYQSQGNEVPAAMQAVWDWEHEQMIEQTAEIKLMLSM